MRIIKVLLGTSACVFLLSGATFAKGPSNHRLTVRQMVLAELSSNRAITGNLASHLSWDLSAIPEQAEADGIELVGRDWDPIQKCARFRLRCSPRMACTPFVVALPMSRADFMAGAPMVPGRISVPRSLTPVVVKAGDPVTLTRIQPGIRMTTTVFSLESGREGEQIRVRTDNRQVIRACVVDAGHVEVKFGGTVP